MRNERKSIFVCYTPFQVFNALNLVIHNVNGTGGHSDICVERNFAHAGEIAEQLKKSGLFGRVYEFFLPDIKRRFLHRAAVLAGTLFPVWSIKKLAGSDFDLPGQGYQALYASVWGLFAVNLINHYGIETVCLFEDGLASYEGSMKNKVSFLYRAVFQFLNLGCMGVKEQAVYLYRPAMYQGKPSELVKKMPEVKECGKFIRTCKEIFGYKENDTYQKRRFIYLEIVMSEVSGCRALPESLFVNVFVNVKPLRSRLLVRRHPRASQKPETGVRIDTGENMWELEAMEHITDRHVLISYYSTAMFTPKMLFDREPYLIFTYHIWRVNESDEETKKLQRIVQFLKDSYRNPEKVMTPHTIEEYEAICIRI